jgi:regulator of protease activity HflC (stomatin/prohibitin superfamily)
MSEFKDGVIVVCTLTAIAVLVIVLLVGAIFGLSALHSKYSVWSEGKAGQAELQKADWNRQILVREAKAKEESAVLLAQAEVERAKGVAKANKIIGASLQDNEAYLRYLWINNLETGKNQVIYVPTEANLPILEANRFSQRR